MTLRYVHAGRGVAACAALVVACLTPGFGSSATAAVDRDGLKDNGRWMFSATDFGDSDGGKANDPMTILYFGGRYKGRRIRDDKNASFETTPHVRDTIKTYWRGNGDFNSHRCNRGDTYLKYRGHDKRDKTDLDLSTSSTCKNQWHTRIWNDKEINGNAESDAKWEVGGIHREHRCRAPIACKHKLSISFESAEVKYLRALKTCHKHDWRSLPGSGPKKFHGQYSNGKISRVSMTPLSSGCRGAWAR